MKKFWYISGDNYYHGEFVYDDYERCWNKAPTPFGVDSFDDYGFFVGHSTNSFLRQIYETEEEVISILIERFENKLNKLKERRDEIHP